MKALWSQIPSCEVTDPGSYGSRRRMLRDTGLAACGLALAGSPATRAALACVAPDNGALALGPGDTASRFEEISRYNNYYEFSTNKEVIHILAREFTPRPWTLTVDGEVEHPKIFDLDALAVAFGAEERTYRFRCVEGWSMVVPWTGFPLCRLIERCAPTSRARFAEFESVLRPTEMIGQRQKSLEWPYREGLRIDEAMHPLTFIATGLYGQDLPAQNGAPLRLVVPWKYGFKSIKAIARIHLRSTRPDTTWPLASPGEYGFYANVNPDVSSPKWSQRREVRIGEVRKRRTLMYNGYGQAVAHLYRGMDLRLHF